MPPKRTSAPKPAATVTTVGATTTTPAGRAAFLLCALVVAAAGLWWVTAGLGEPTEPAPFGNIFDDLARSFFKGRVDVNCEIAAGEAFVVDNKCYLYFGPVPALLRLPVLAAAPGLFGRLCRLMVWAANLLLLFFLILILREAGHAPGSWASSGFLLLAAFGSTIPYMWSWPTGYVEAISWATAFAAGALYCLLRWSHKESSAWLGAACLLGLAAFFSRVNTGAGPLAVAGVLALRDWWRGGARRQAATAILALLAAFAGVFLAYNHARFGTLFDAFPARYHIQYKGERLERIKGTFYHPIQAPPIFYDYLFHLPRFRASYPWLEFNPSPAADVGVVDMHDPHTGALPVMPALAFLAWGGWRSLQKRGRRERWLLLLAPLPGLLLLASIVCISHRYLHEFILLLAPAAAYGVTWAWSAPRRRSATIALAVFGLFANWAVALVASREVLPWTNVAAQDAHRATRFRVDRWLRSGGSQSQPIVFDPARDSAAPHVEGVEVQIARSGSRYVYSAGRWQWRSGPPMHRFTVRVPGSAVMAQPRTTILMAGRPPQAEVIAVDRSNASAGRYRVCIEHWGWEQHKPCGDELSLEAGQTYEFVCDLDRLNRRVQVSLNGAVVAARNVELHNWIEESASTTPPVELLAPSR